MAIPESSLLQHCPCHWHAATRGTLSTVNILMEKWEKALAQAFFFFFPTNLGKWKQDRAYKNDRFRFVILALINVCPQLGFVLSADPYLAPYYVLCVCWQSQLQVPSCLIPDSVVDHRMNVRQIHAWLVQI